MADVTHKLTCLPLALIAVTLSACVYEPVPPLEEGPPVAYYPSAYSIYEYPPYPYGYYGGPLVSFGYGYRGHGGRGGRWR